MPLSPTPRKRPTASAKARSAKPEKLSRTHAPAGLSPLEWQRALRRQFGREQAFGLENLGAEPFFSEFRISNRDSRSSYRVAIRGLKAGDNFCERGNRLSASDCKGIGLPSGVIPSEGLNNLGQSFPVPKNRGCVDSNFRRIWIYQIHILRLFAVSKQLPPSRRVLFFGLQ